MTRKKIDALWFEAMQQSIAAGEDFIRYHFAALVAAAEREACAKMCERLPAQQDIDVRDQCAAAIRARGEE